MTPFAVTSRREAGRLVVVPTGELDIATAGAVRAEAARRAPGEGLVLDLRGITFLDTSGLQIAVEFDREARAEGVEWRILRAPPPVHRVFAIAGLEEILPFADGEGGDG